MYFFFVSNLTLAILKLFRGVVFLNIFKHRHVYKFLRVLWSKIENFSFLMDLELVYIIEISIGQCRTISSHQTQYRCWNMFVRHPSIKHVDVVSSLDMVRVSCRNFEHFSTFTYSLLKAIGRGWVQLFKNQHRTTK